MQFVSADPSIAIDEAVAASEQRTGYRNIALANYMKSFDVLDNPVDFTLGVYFHHCAIAMSCRQLATAGRFLAHLGRNPATGLSVVTFYHRPDLANLPVTMQHIGVMIWVFPAALLMQRVGRSIGFRVGSLIGMTGAVVMSVGG